MRTTASLTDTQLGTTLARYATGLYELARRSRRLRSPVLAPLVEQAINAIDRVRSSLHLPVSDPDDAPLHFLLLALDNEAMELVGMALTRAAELAGRVVASRSSLLASISCDFVATNDWKFEGEEQRIRFLSKFEALTGYKFIIVDPKVGEIIYGLSVLEQLARHVGADDRGGFR